MSKDDDGTVFMSAIRLLQNYSDGSAARMFEDDYQQFRRLHLRLEDNSQGPRADSVFRDREARMIGEELVTTVAGMEFFSWLSVDNLRKCYINKPIINILVAVNKKIQSMLDLTGKPRLSSQAKDGEVFSENNLSADLWKTVERKELEAIAFCLGVEVKKGGRGRTRQFDANQGRLTERDLLTTLFCSNKPHKELDELVGHVSAHDGPYVVKRQLDPRFSSQRNSGLYRRPSFLSKFSDDEYTSLLAYLLSNVEEFVVFPHPFGEKDHQVFLPTQSWYNKFVAQDAPLMQAMARLTWFCAEPSSEAVISACGGAIDGRPGAGAASKRSGIDGGLRSAFRNYLEEEFCDKFEAIENKILSQEYTNDDDRTVALMAARIKFDAERAPVLAKSSVAVDLFCEQLFCYFADGTISGSFESFKKAAKLEERYFTRPSDWDKSRRDFIEQILGVPGMEKVFQLVCLHFGGSFLVGMSRVFGLTGDLNDSQHVFAERGSLEIELSAFNMHIKPSFSLDQQITSCILNDPHFARLRRVNLKKAAAEAVPYANLLTNSVMLEKAAGALIAMREEDDSIDDLSDDYKALENYIDDTLLYLKTTYPQGITQTLPDKCNELLAGALNRLPHRSRLLPIDFQRAKIGRGGAEDQPSSEDPLAILAKFYKQPPGLEKTVKKRRERRHETWRKQTGRDNVTRNARPSLGEIVASERTNERIPTVTPTPKIQGSIQLVRENDSGSRSTSPTPSLCELEPECRKRDREHGDSATEADSSTKKSKRRGASMTIQGSTEPIPMSREFAEQFISRISNLQHDVDFCIEVSQEPKDTEDRNEEAIDHCTDRSSMLNEGVSNKNTGVIEATQVKRWKLQWTVASAQAAVKTVAQQEASGVGSKDTDKSRNGSEGEA